MEEAFAIPPEHLVGADMLLNEMAADIGIYTGGLVAFDEDGEPYLHPCIGKGGNERRKENRENNVWGLQKKYHTIWGKRGTAKVIALDEGLSVRTVQQYFKDFPTS